MKTIILAILSSRSNREHINSMLYSAQIRAARALIHWSQEDLAKKAGIGVATVRRIEVGDGLVSGNVTTVFRIQKALERAGIRFTTDDESDGIGVRLILRRTTNRER